MLPRMSRARRFMANRGAMVGAAVAVMLVALAVLAPVL